MPVAGWRTGSTRDRWAIRRARRSMLALAAPASQLPERDVLDPSNPGSHRRNTVARRFGLILAVAALAACGAGPVSVAPPAGPTPPPSLGEATSPGAVLTAEPASATSTPPPTPSHEVPSTAQPRPTKLQMRLEEQFLLHVLRDDVAQHCEPRRSGLPARATAAIECAVDAPFVDSVGVYGFDLPAAAALAYLERMNGEGSLGADGDCLSGTPGDSSWDGPEGSEDNAWQVTYGERVYSAARVGCFLNEHGMANVRATCDDAYIGVLGTTADIAQLTKWVLQGPAGEDPIQGPGICFGEFGGGLP